jgi:UPF0755 protein
MINNPGNKIRTKRLLSKRDFLIVILFFFVLLIIAYLTFYTPNYYVAESPLKIEIKKGENFNKVVETLYQMKVIPSKFNFKVAGFIYGASTRIQPARYKIPNGLSYMGLLDLLMSGNGDQLRTIKLYDGISIRAISGKLKSEKILDDDSIIQLANSKSIANSYDINAPSLLGYLLPDKYDFYENSSANEIIGIMTSSFKNFFNDTLKQRAKESGFSVQQVIILASIVQGETRNPGEMPRIAEVYLNRLKLGMKLQACPTVQFLLPEGWKLRLLDKDLRINSPYNTYIYSGLPPGAIDNPGKSAILAVLYPEKNDYLYFVADGTGTHHFSKSYTEQRTYATKYYKLLSKKKQK